MANNPNPLVPTPIVNKNGVQTTVHKKMASNGAGVGVIPAPGTAAPKPTNAKDLNWNSMSPAEAVQRAKAVLPTIGDPDKLWENFEFFTGMLNSPHHLEAKTIVERDEVLGTLRGAWLDKHGMVLDVDRDKYSKIKGPDGYNAFLKARDKFSTAVLRPEIKGTSPSSSSESDSGYNPKSGGVLNIFRDRRERRELQRQQEQDVDFAVGLITGMDSDAQKEIMKTLDTPESMRKASDLVRLFHDYTLSSEEHVRNIARGLRVDGEGHQVLNALYAHRDYLAEDPNRIGTAIAMVVHMTNQKSLYQLPDGTVPHLSGYVETLEDVAREGREARNQNVKITTTDASIAFSRYNRVRQQSV